MNGKQISGGCVGIVGLSFLGLGLSMALTGPLDGAICSMIMGLGPLAMAVALLRSAKLDAELRAERLQEQRERQILAVAARHNGAVTPALVAMHSVDFSIVTAKQMLDQLASVGLCAAEADDDGGLHYVFDLSGRRPRPELSPEEWVADRMRGEDPLDHSALEDAE